MRRNFDVAKGFTLLEVLVVIAIVAILAASLFPVLAHAKGKARRTACINNLHQINLGIHLFADDANDTMPGARTNSAADPFTVYKKLMKRYVGMEGTSERSAIFACPADTFYYDYDTRVPQSLHLQSRYSYSSYAFNAGNSLSGTPPVHPWPGIVGRQLSSIKEPAKTVLVAEFPACFPYSWHEPEGRSHYNDARNVVGCVDGHVSYIKIYWDTNNTTPGHQEAWHYDPPAGYDYKWSGD